MNCLGINPSSFIKALVRQANFKGNLDTEGFKTGLVFSFEFHCDYFSEVGNADQRETVHFMILGRSNAFIRRGSPGEFRPSLSATKPEEWINIGNHDSCWIDSVDSE